MECYECEEIYMGWFSSSIKHIYSLRWRVGKFPYNSLRPFGLILFDNSLLLVTIAKQYMIIHVTDELE